ncbi:MAG: TadE/TadG family type IV pilus assembly protein [Maritimibacter sp.]
MKPPRQPRVLARFRKADEGAALVEFGLLLPVLLLFLALSIEGGRTFVAYQTAIAGVRDASRYLSRAMPANACDTGASTAEWDEKLKDIVSLSQDGESAFSPTVSIGDVTSALVCTSGDYRGGAAPIATITAELEISLPFSAIFSSSSKTAISTFVRDSTRIIGS